MQRGHGMVLAVSALTLSTMGGCIVERSYDTAGGFDRQTRTDVVDRVAVDDVVVEEPGVAIIQAAYDGLLQGDIGPAQKIDDDQAMVGFYDDGWYTAVETVTVLPDRAAMLMLSVSNPDAVFVPGERQWNLADQQGETQVMVLGCTGRDVGNYDEYDVPADEVDVIVEETPTADELEVQVHARFLTIGGELETASSSFRLVRR